MNKLFKLIVVALCLVGVGSAEANDQLLQQAADLYAAQSYEKAADVYASVLKTNVVSPELYYNYANACYKSGQLGQAILNYERALVLRPNYEDAKFNLAFVNAKIADKIEPIESFFLTEWMESLGNLLTANQWAITSISAFVVCLILGLLYVFASHRSLRKVGFFGALTCLALSVVALSYSFSLKNKAQERAEAI
ncbi:MAG: tetratricopeptide repeat protein, partial [Sphingobacteriia bacterium]|nr:tetratricopeptide repeat protein [Sphingobacteriia bacterium]